MQRFARFWGQRVRKKGKMLLHGAHHRARTNLAVSAALTQIFEMVAQDDHHIGSEVRQLTLFEIQQSGFDHTKQEGVELRERIAIDAGQALQHRIGSDLGYDLWFVLDATAGYDLPSVDGSIVTAAQLARSTAAIIEADFGRVIDTETACASVSVASTV